VANARPRLREVLWETGVQRGTDVIKALCLGARAVGVGKMLDGARGERGGD
jgi:isopentenyl diphosphate isomerase/L-lactate dehydrogenase-like FMN-dependent dehydrogenase